ncbi:MAG: hypothetical protein HYY01_15140 [Chloroflexi bacterium]|nr:hypothetical protein [Chloroflexota bacterium]
MNWRWLRRSLGLRFAMMSGLVFLGVNGATPFSGTDSSATPPGLLFGATGSAVGASKAAAPVTTDTMYLTDDPGNWFRSATTGIPLSVVDIGDSVEVDFRLGQFTGTRHTVTLLLRPPSSKVASDQASSINGKVTVKFDVPGVYLFGCKVHPYMTGVVAVKDAAGNIPDVPKAELPFIGHLGAASLPATTVLGVLTTVAASDADKLAKWDIFGPGDEFKPAVPGVGEVWVDSQFERVPGQADGAGIAKPGSITVLNAATFTIEREINGLDPGANGKWNNPHNMWANDSLSVVYNGNWFGRAINKIDRNTGRILDTIEIGEAPTHIVTIPDQASAQFGVLTTPLSADDDLVKMRDAAGGLSVASSHATGAGHNHPHGHWISADGKKIVVPNVFKGLGIAGSISIMDATSGAVLKEIRHQPQGLESALLLPIASGIKGSSKAYVTSLASGQVSVVDLNLMRLVKNIPVTFTPNGLQGPQFGIFDTLQVPIQPPVSPDGRFVGVAVLSLTTVPRSPTGSADHVAIIDTATDTVVKYLATPAGTHGAHWGAKAGGGYYLYVTNQHSNALTIIDADPNGDGSASDAAVVGRIVLANGSAGAGATDGTGGQGLKPLPNVYDGWVQDTVALSGTGRLSAEVQGWVDALTPAQRNPAP